MADGTVAPDDENSPYEKENGNIETEAIERFKEYKTYKEIIDVAWLVNMLNVAEQSEIYH